MGGRFLGEHFVVPLKVIERASDFEPLFGNVHAHRFDRVPLTTPESEDAYAALQELIRDVCDIWPEVEVSHRMNLVRSLQPTLDTLRDLGFAVSAGTGDMNLPGAKGTWTAIFVFVSTKNEPMLFLMVPKKMDITLG